MDADGLQLVKLLARRHYGRDAEVEQVVGTAGGVWRIRIAGNVRKVLKLRASGPGRGVRKEIAAIELLGRYNLPVPHIEHLGSEGGAGGREYFIMPCAGERTVADSIQGDKDTAARLFAEMGAVLAQIHSVTLPGSGDIQPSGFVSHDRQQHVARVRDLADWAASVQVLSREQADALGGAELPEIDGHSPCHTDFHAVHCVVADEHIRAVVDWESAWSGSPWIDLAVAHAYLDFYCPAELTRAFLAGYGTVRQVPQSYAREYLLVRMAHMAGMMHVWFRQGQTDNLQRARQVFEAYAAHIEP